MGQQGLGWPSSGVPRVEPKLRSLRVIPGMPQLLWVGTVHPRLLATLFALEGPAEFGQLFLASLSHRDIELIVLRATWNAGHYHHWSLHALWGRVREGAGFVDAVQTGPEASRWDRRRATVLRAVDELHDDLAVGEATVLELFKLGYTERDLIEICFITAHYEMLGMLLESSGMPPESFIPAPDPAADPAPRHRRNPARVFASGLDRHSPWHPMDDHLLQPHPVLRFALRRFARGATRWSTLDRAHLAAALSRTKTMDPRTELLRRAVTDLDREYFLSDETWQALRKQLTLQQILELCVVVGHYRMHEMIVNTIEPIELT